MQEDVRSFTQGGDSEWEMTPRSPVEMPAHPSPPHALLGACPAAITQHSKAKSSVHCTMCPAESKHFGLVQFWVGWRWARSSCSLSTVGMTILAMPTIDANTFTTKILLLNITAKLCTYPLFYLPSVTCG